MIEVSGKTLEAMKLLTELRRSHRISSVEFDMIDRGIKSALSDAKKHFAVDRKGHADPLPAQCKPNPDDYETTGCVDIILTKPGESE